MRDCTHAYIGYRKDGKPVLIFVDDGSEELATACARVIRTGGRIERMTVNEAKSAMWPNRETP